MTSVFGAHFPEIPYQPLAELFAQYRDRDPHKIAIVDLESGTKVTFGALEQVTTDIAVFLKGNGVRHGSRVLLLSDEKSRKATVVVRRVASRRGGVPAQYRNQRENLGRPCSGDGPSAHSVPQGPRHRRAC